MKVMETCLKPNQRFKLSCRRVTFVPLQVNLAFPHSSNGY